MFNRKSKAPFHIRDPKILPNNFRQVYYNVLGKISTSKINDSDLKKLPNSLKKYIAQNNIINHSLESIDFNRIIQWEVFAIYAQEKSFFLKEHEVVNSLALNFKSAIVSSIIEINAKFNWYFFQDSFLIDLLINNSIKEKLDNDLILLLIKNILFSSSGTFNIDEQKLIDQFYPKISTIIRDNLEAKDLNKTIVRERNRIKTNVRSILNDYSIDNYDNRLDSYIEELEKIEKDVDTINKITKINTIYSFEKLYDYLKSNKIEFYITKKINGYDNTNDFIHDIFCLENDFVEIIGNRKNIIIEFNTSAKELIRILYRAWKVEKIYSLEEFGKRFSLNSIRFKGNKTWLDHDLYIDYKGKIKKEFEKKK